MMLDDKCTSLIAYYWCTPLDGNVQRKKMALSQLTFEKRKWILKCYGKMGMRLRYRGVGEMNLEFDAGGGHFEHL
jgi:hypothetical protein